MGAKPTPAALLDYAKPLPWRHRRATRRIFLTLLMAIGAVVVWRYVPSLIRVFRAHYCYRQCADFVGPQDIPIFEPSTNEAPTAPIAEPYLSGFDAELALLPGAQGMPTISLGTVRVPRCLVRLLQATPGAMPLAIDGVSVPFCHERISPAGHHRLVYVTCDPIYIGGLHSDGGFSAAAIRQTTLSALVAGPRSPLTGSVFDPIPPNMNGPTLPTILPGRIDAADAGHFTIAYQWWDGTCGTIDGWLDDDDTVMLVVRHGPADLHAEHESRTHHPELWQPPDDPSPHPPTTGP